MKTLTKPVKSQSISPRVYGYDDEQGEGTSWQWVGEGYTYTRGWVDLYECLFDDWDEYECDEGDTYWE